MTPNRRTLIGLAMTAPIALAFPRIASAAEPEIFQVDGVAIRGTDPNAYFRTGGPVAGNAQFMSSWKGATWQFATEADKAAFDANPEGIAPEFGGYCAYAASLGYLAPTVPEAWTIYEGRLYLNASLRARELWLNDVPGNIAKGLSNWPGILG